MLLLLLFWLFTKHLIFDFIYQPPYMWMNKGKYGHWGGLVHAGLHSIVSLLILNFFIELKISVVLAALEFIIHYHMDWFKMWFNAKKNWKCNTHEEFWQLTGIDQYVHSLTYLLICWLAINV